jgi:hypothetical protein
MKCNHEPERQLISEEVGVECQGRWKVRMLRCRLCGELYAELGFCEAIRGRTRRSSPDQGDLEWAEMGED